MKNILVTGSRGLLGSSLKKELFNRKLKFIPHNRGISTLGTNQQDILDNFIKINNVDTLIHCSAKVGGVKANMDNNNSFFSENISINNEVLQTAFNNNIKNLISILSTCIFPNENVNYPLTVNQLDNGQPHHSNSGYSYAKRLLYYQTKMYKDFTGYNWNSIIPTNIYGACFSDDTNVLTPNGIKNIKDFVIGDVVYGLNPKTHEVEIEKVISVQKVKTKEFIVFKNTNVDFKVTKDHKMYYADKNDFIKEYANVFMDKNGKIKFAKHKPLDSDYSFLQSVCRTKDNKEKNDYIHRCFKLGLKTHTENDCTKINNKFSFNCNDVYTEVVDEFAYCITTEKNHIIYAGRNDNYNWIGQCDNYDLDNSHIIPALIRKGYEASLNDGKLHVWGDGTPLRQFIYSDDLSKIILYVIENWNSNKPFMAVNPIEYSISDIANIIADRFKLEIVYDKEKPSGQFRKPAITDVPSDFKFTSLEEGLNKSIDWFVSNYNNCRK